MRIAPPNKSKEEEGKVAGGGRERERGGGEMTGDFFPREEISRSLLVVDAIKSIRMSSISGVIAGIEYFSSTSEAPDASPLTSGKPGRWETM